MLLVAVKLVQKGVCRVGRTVANAVMGSTGPSAIRIQFLPDKPTDKH